MCTKMEQKCQVSQKRVSELIALLRAWVACENEKMKLMNRVCSEPVFYDAEERNILLP